jgi:hypothetical protein
MAFKSFVLCSVISIVSRAHCQALNSLSQLNETLGGRVLQTRPLAAPCYEQPNGTECASIRDQIASTSSSTFRADLYSGFEYIQSEACVAVSNDQCLLDSVNLQPIPNSTCEQGLVSPEYIEVFSASDVQAAFELARQTGTKLSIKNSGHDYLGRGTRRGSLALWMRGLKNMTYEPEFTPAGCSSDDGEPLRAITFGAGVNTDEALAFAHDYGVVTTTASGETIGVSGAFVLGGGHGFLSNSFGLAVDRVVQFTVVTPDGQVQKVNRCANPDLFWALRGGGPVFGVVIDSTQQVELETPVTSVVLALLTSTADQRRNFASILVDNMMNWSISGWGGSSGTSYLALVNSGLNSSEAQTQLAPAINYVNGSSGLVMVQTFDSYFDFYTNLKSGPLAPASPISVAVIPTNRIVPGTVFQNDTSRAYLVDAVMASEEAGLTTALMTTTPFSYAQNHSDITTSIHPAWYESVVILASSGQFSATSSISERQAVAALVRDTTESVKEMIPDGCSYANEADPGEEDWAVQTWGPNYSKLLQLKQSIDPDMLLQCWHCVGWEPSMADYECISGL